MALPNLDTALSGQVRNAAVCDWPYGEFSRWLRSTRKERGLVQAGLAETVGVSRAYLSRLENGRHSGIPRPKASLVRAIARELHTPEAVALERAGYIAPGRDTQFHPDEVRRALLRDPRIGPDVVGVVFQLYVLLRRRPAS